jgi:hypothetical protein
VLGAAGQVLDPIDHIGVEFGERDRPIVQKVGLAAKALDHPALAKAGLNESKHDIMGPAGDPDRIRTRGA